MPKYFIFPIYTLVLFVSVLALVPRKDIHRLAFYGLFLGAIPDVILILLLHVSGLAGYRNLGPFGFLNIPFFPPIAWTAFFILFLYFLPRVKPWNYLYVAAAAGYATMFSNILQNLNVFQWHYGNLLIPYIFFISWFAFFTWAYYRLHSYYKQQQPVQLSNTAQVARRPALKNRVIRMPKLKLNPFSKNKLK